MAKVALMLCIVLTAWLYIRDNKIRPMTSSALWIPLLWIIISGSRHVSAWFSGGTQTEAPDSYLEGSPLDRNMYLMLIIFGLIVLFRRNIDWSKVFSSNRWVFFFFLYWGISAIWTDYPFISIKRWIKDFGNIIMALIVFTETVPAQAFKAVFSRYISFAIPFSVVLILFFPELGTYQDEYAADPAFSGVTTNKNGLGIIIAVSGLFMAWDFVESWIAEKKKTNVVDLVLSIVLMALLIWLLVVARSSTALVCLPVGLAALFLLHLDPVRRNLTRLVVFSTVAAILIFSLDLVSIVVNTVAGVVGREPTFTGRTDIWHDLLREDVNPLLGAGYQGFWLRHGMIERYDGINQAHNGYLQTYLDGGLLGLGLLLAMIASTGRKLIHEIAHGSSLGMILFSFLVVAVLYNLTEGLFNGRSLIWFAMLLAALCPQAHWAFARKFPLRRAVTTRGAFGTGRAETIQ